MPQSRVAEDPPHHHEYGQRYDRHWVCQAPVQARHAVFADFRKREKQYIRQKYAKIRIAPETRGKISCRKASHRTLRTARGTIIPADEPKQTARHEVRGICAYGKIHYPRKAAQQDTSAICAGAPVHLRTNQGLFVMSLPSPSVKLPTAIMMKSITVQIPHAPSVMSCNTPVPTFPT